MGKRLRRLLSAGLAAAMLISSASTLLSVSAQEVPSDDAGYVWVSKAFSLKESDFAHHDVGASQPTVSTKLNPRIFWRALDADSRMPVTLTVKKIRIEKTSGELVEEFTSEKGAFNAGDVSEEEAKKRVVNEDGSVTFPKGMQSSNGMHVTCYSDGAVELAKGNYDLVIKYQVKITDYDEESFKTIEAAQYPANVNIWNPNFCVNGEAGHEIHFTDVPMNDWLYGTPDRSGLAASIEACKDLSKDAYSAADWHALQKQLAAANEMYASDEWIGQDTLDAMTAMLDSARENTLLTQAKAGLQTLTDNIDAKKYTETYWETASWSAFAAALQSAKDELAKNDATVESLLERKAALAAAEEGLVFKEIVIGTGENDQKFVATDRSEVTADGLKTKIVAKVGDDDGTGDGRVLQQNIGNVPTGRYQIEYQIKLLGASGGAVANADTSQTVGGQGGQKATKGRELREGEFKVGESAKAYVIENYREDVEALNLQLWAWHRENNYQFVIEKITVRRLGDAYPEGVYGIEGCESQHANGTVGADGITGTVGSNNGCILNDNYLNRAVTGNDNGQIPAGRWLLKAYVKIAEKPGTNAEVAHADLYSNPYKPEDAFQSLPIIMSDDFAEAGKVQEFTYIVEIPENITFLQTRFQWAGNVTTTIERFTYQYLGESIDAAVVKALEDSIAEIKALDAEAYTEESWYDAKVDALLAEAESLLTKVGGTAADFTAMAEKLGGIKDQLISTAPGEVEKVALKKLIDTCKTIEIGNYTENSFAVLTRAIQRAEEVYAAGQTAEEFTAATEMLQKAKDALKHKATSFTVKVKDYVGSVADDVKEFVTLYNDEEAQDTYLEYKVRTPAWPDDSNTRYAPQFKGPLAKGDSIILRVKLLEPIDGSVDRVLNIDAYDFNYSNLTEVGVAINRTNFDESKIGEWQEIKLPFPVVHKESYTNTTYRVYYDCNAHFLLDTITIKGEEAELVDISKLEELMAELDQLRAEDYTEESWAKLAAKMQEAEALLVDPSITQAMVSSIITALTSAKNNLETYATETELKVLSDLITSYKDLQKADYTSATWAAYESQLNLAKELVESGKATKKEVDAMAQALKTAKDGLKAIATAAERKALNDLIASCSGLKAADYTTESWTYFNVKLTAAKALAADSQAIKADIDDMYASLKAAKDALVEVAPTPTDGWIRSGSTWYFYKNGTMQKDWYQEKGNWYYLGTDGKMRTGWFQVGKTWYFANSWGKMLTGWKQLGNQWYYFASSGAMQTGWYQAGKKWYFSNSGGKMQTGWKQIGGKWYYLGSNGAMRTGWYQVGKTWYFSNNSGAMQTGWVKSGSKWYFMASSGAMKTGWVKLGGKWYYMTSNGAMKTGWLKLGNKWYFMDNSGKMIASTSRKVGKKTYRFNASGVCLNP